MYYNTPTYKVPIGTCVGLNHLDASHTLGVYISEEGDASHSCGLSSLFILFIVFEIDFVAFVSSCLVPHRMKLFSMFCKAYLMALLLINKVMTNAELFTKICE